MTGSKKTDGSVSFGKIGKVYRETLGQISNTAYKHVRLLNEHVLFADGHLKRSVSVIIQALETTYQSIIGVSRLQINRLKLPVFMFLPIKILSSIMFAIQMTYL